MKIVETRLPGVLRIEPQVFGDSRGLFFETWQANRYQKADISGPFVQSNFAQSQRDVIRGLHYQLKHPQGKLVWVTRGEIFDVVVDIRVGSPTFGQWVGEELSDVNHVQLYIPPGFAHGYGVISEIADVQYLCTDFYEPNDEYGIRWDDEMLKITWPISAPTVSEKDRLLPNLKDVSKTTLPLFDLSP
ncbi:dTDP-4-dehydrorhamnose 3,5-epimerase [Candidatus Nitronereus thalassa]|uniref:dTDP-4-dehydrorhamnose 3,5-epimerase n=1 Tax=Candidatus Nitronereus thalassa TaxID=3020898 RepID=A0ABU3KCF1_9BACT|nr:dTDP-4-dehydrorhamnose 3,5-epimerase [Candidatus Nitronereus thalassa]MDT7044071.1 dTDP-4-dehydrorhamnose 3,5-epimerase [Candidatus Nitronereus thalassa]